MKRLFVAKGSIAGAIVGTLAGGLGDAAVEEATTRQEGLEITVKLDHGHTIAVVPADVRFQAGDRLGVISGRGVTRVEHARADREDAAMITRNLFNRFVLTSVLAAVGAFWICRLLGAGPLDQAWAVLSAMVVLAVDHPGTLNASLDRVIGTVAGGVVAALFGRRDAAIAAGRAGARRGGGSPCCTRSCSSGGRGCRCSAAPRCFCSSPTPTPAAPCDWRRSGSCISRSALPFRWPFRWPRPNCFWSVGSVASVSSTADLQLNMAEFRRICCFPRLPVPLLPLAASIPPSILTTVASKVLARTRGC
jgi:outer membrane lipoprotein SlyB